MPTTPTCALINRTNFFAKVKPLFGGKLRQEQVDGMNAIIDEYEARRLQDIRWLAYILATVKLETGETMQPIKEKGGDAYLFKMYDIRGSRPAKAKGLGNLTTGDGVKYAGKGLVQATGKRNYTELTRQAKLQGYTWDFVKHPDLLLQMRPSVWSAYHGMLTGLYTGRKLADYFNATTQAWTGARAIINGKDRASEIGELGQAFYKALV